MKVSSRARQGARVMLELALNYGNGPVRVRDIAKRQGLSAKYLEQLVGLMRGAGLVTAARGVHGGYTLARPPARINMRQIFEPLEGPLSQVGCRDCPGRCNRAKECTARDVWSDLERAMAASLEGRTLEDVAARAREKEKIASSIYYI